MIAVRRMNWRLLSPKVLLGDQPVNCICVCMVDDEKGSFWNLQFDECETYPLQKRSLLVGWGLNGHVGGTYVDGLE